MSDESQYAIKYGNKINEYLNKMYFKDNRLKKSVSFKPIFIEIISVEMVE